MPESEFLFRCYSDPGYGPTGAYLRRSFRSTLPSSNSSTMLVKEELLCSALSWQPWSANHQTSTPEHRKSLFRFLTRPPLRPRSPIPTGLPRYPEHLSDVPSPIPRRAKLGGQMVSSAQLPQPSPFCRRVGVRVFTFEACSAFTHIMARTDRSTAHGGLYHGASVQPVTRSNCPLATGPNEQVSRWVLPPLVFRALAAHYRKIVAWPCRGYLDRHHQAQRHQSRSLAGRRALLHQ